MSVRSIQSRWIFYLFTILSFAAFRGRFFASALPTDTLRTRMSFHKIAQEELFVSEPNPEYFGNANNPSSVPDTWSTDSKNWLKSRFHFRFAEYRDGPPNFGVLRVMNDDLVQPDRGFGAHPHRDMEIVTYIIEGALTHKDSMGSEETLSRGGFQYMSAGTGVRHSEKNLDKVNPLRFIQMWVVPRTEQTAPQYGGFAATKADYQNKFLHAVSDIENTEVKTPVKLNQDVNMYVSEIDEGKHVFFDVTKDRQLYMLCLEGDVDVSGDSGLHSLAKHDAATVMRPNQLSFTAKGGPTHVLLVEMLRDVREQDEHI